MKKIILASASPRRKELLSQMGLDYEVKISNVDEKIEDPSLIPEEIVLQIALKKAESVAKNSTEGVIISADTIVVIDNEILGKPKDELEAENMLKKLSGRSHEVYTAVVIKDLESKILLHKVQKTVVYMLELTEEQIKKYVKTKEPLDKAGSYGIQGYGALFVEKIQGDYFNVMGMPISILNQMLKRVGIKTVL